MCGDCNTCTNAAADMIFTRNIKRVSVLACLFLMVGGFMFFAPVVSLPSVGSAQPVTTGVISIKIQTTETASTDFCSITFCYLGQGAAYARGVYYPVTHPLPSSILKKPVGKNSLIAVAT
jgi:hypothetical protein